MSSSADGIVAQSKRTSNSNIGPNSNLGGRQKALSSYLLYILLFILSSAHLLNTFRSISNHPIYPQSDTNNVPFEWDKVNPTPELKWHNCLPNRQCARLEVPLDYNNPTGEKAAIAMIRIKAILSPSSEKYRGPILFNPGGPGGSGVSAVNTMGELFQKVLGVEYDIVGFDPRGVALTTPAVSVFSDASERAYWDAGTPPLINSTSDSFLHTYARSKLFGDLSMKRTKHAAEYVSTATVARDMLTITQAHGRQKLLYWGFSYGTVLGATYAAMFPDNIERLVIDGVVDFNDYYSGGWSKNLKDTDKILQLFYHECATAGTVCPLYANSSILVQRRVENILTNIKASPLPVLDDITSGFAVVDYRMVKNDLFRALYNPFTELTQYANVLAALEKGDGRAALTYWQKFHKQLKCNSAKPTILPGNSEGGIAIRCGEGQGASRDYEDLVQQFNELSTISMFADVWMDLTRAQCAGWEVKVKDRYGGPFNTTTSFPLLIVGNTADPVTPLIGAVNAALWFKGSSLLTVDTPGVCLLPLWVASPTDEAWLYEQHCSLAATSPSAIGHIRRYFREGIMPPAGTVCEIEDTFFGRPKQAFHVATAKDKDIIDATRLLSRHFHELRAPEYLL